MLGKEPNEEEHKERFSNEHIPPFILSIQRSISRRRSEALYALYDIIITAM